MVFVDAGTVHAIGPGVMLLETQQTCDVTFRMYDYGRPRELHVEQALGVMKTKTAAGKVAPKKMDAFVRLIEQQYFVVERYEVGAGREVVIPIAEAGCLVGLAGAAMVEAMACATVPKIVLTLNHASGAGYYAMAGQGFDPHFTFALPTARIGVMEGDAAVQAVLFYLSWCFPPIFLVTLVDGEKRCLHDILAGVVIVRRM